MSLAIDVDKITGVLLADGWHVVDKNREGKSTFGIDSYEYLWYCREDKYDPEVLLGGGRDSHTTAYGAHWEERGGVEMFCPITSILAVHYGDSKRGERS